jgi:pilus assembly protein Flp/PilA
MARFKNAVSALLRDEEGATMVEYALLVALIAIVTIAGVSLLGEEANGTLEDAADTIAGN